MTQREIVLYHLQHYGSITPQEAEAQYKIKKLSNRIHDLKQDGHKIITEIKNTRNGSGGYNRYTRYYIDGPTPGDENCRECKYRRSLNGYEHGSCCHYILMEGNRRARINGKCLSYVPKKSDYKEVKTENA